MKKSLCLLLSVVMAISCVMGVDLTALAESTITDDNGYIYELPAAPTVYCESTGPTFVKVSWEFNDYVYFDFVEFRMYNENTKQYELVKRLSSNAKSYNIYDLKKNTVYKFSVCALVRSVDDVLYSGEAGYAAVRTSPSDTTIKSLKYLSDGRIQIQWNSVSGVSGYIIKYSLDPNMGNNAKTCTLVKTGAGSSKTTISGLAKGIYYVSICTFKTMNKIKYCSVLSTPKTVNVKKGVSVKAMLNAIKTDNSGRAEILSLTDKGVDIAKYSTTYEKFKAIFNWHSKHNTDYGWTCMDCNINFNSCVSALMQNSHKSYDRYIYLAAGNYKNNDGSAVMHKWSVIYLAGKAYIFDPRLQGYRSNKTGNDYFGIERGSAKSKPYLFDGWMFYWEYAKDFTNSSESICPSVARPKTVTIDKLSSVKNGFTVKWKKVSGATGYQIIYSTSKSFSGYKSVYVSGSDTISKSIKSLPSGKTYYVKVRAYKNYGKSRLYGAYSSVSTVKIK